MSLDEQVEIAIDSVVRDWIRQEKMFTAFEVSLEVKNRGVNERHRNMKSYIHDSISDESEDQYSRTLLDVGAPVQAWVYHPLYKNPRTYSPLKRNDRPAAPAQPYDGDVDDADTTTPSRLRNPVPLSSDQNPVSASDGVIGTDLEGRLKIPADLISKLSVGVGQAVHLISDRDSGKLIVKRAGSFATGDYDQEFTAGDGSLLIETEILEKSDLDWLQSYRVEYQRGEIIVVQN